MEIIFLDLFSNFKLVRKKKCFKFFFDFFYKIYCFPSGHNLVSRLCDVGCTKRFVKVSNFFKINMGQLDTKKNVIKWWQLECGHGSRNSSKECVTTHEPNLIVSKMDDAKPKNLNKSIWINFKIVFIQICRKYVLRNSKFFFSWD